MSLARILLTIALVGCALEDAGPANPSGDGVPVPADDLGDMPDATGGPLAQPLDMDGAAPEYAAVDAAAPVKVHLHVSPGQHVAPVSPLQAGVNHRWVKRAYGLLRADGTFDQNVVADSQAAGIQLVRYPAGTMANLFSLEHATGPNRGCQIIANRKRDEQTGKWGWASAPEASTPYGPAEHMKFVASIGATTNVMVPFINNSPAGAANFVEYMNAPVGTNPNGGVAWADVRAADGHPAPYHIKHWEVGNEPYFTNQRYWMSATSESDALAQYIDGEHDKRYDNQPLARDCDVTTAAAGDGTAGQHVRTWYAPIQNVTIAVDGHAWTRVADITQASANAAVYQLDQRTGDVVFGDGSHGRIPAAGATLRASYTLDHPGFSSYAQAMKAVDPSIDVCSAWGRPEFASAMDARGQKYDCVAAHPYTIFHASATSPADLYRQSMVGEDTAGDALAKLVSAVGKSPGHPYVEVTEGGEISGQTQPVDSFEATQMHAVYMASLASRVLDLGIPLAEEGDLTSHGMRSVVSRDGSEWVSNGSAAVLAMLSQLVTSGGHVVAHSLDQTPSAGTADERYDALEVATTIDASGRLELWLVNRDLQREITVSVDGFAAGAGRAMTVSADPFVVNDAAHPQQITAVPSHLAAGRPTTYTLPPHSVTWIRLNPS